MAEIVTASRYHDFSAGHRVVGHEGKCVGLHGHNYRVHFHCHAEKLDEVGRVIDFGVIKSRLCDWLEEHWDHKMLLWQRDPFRAVIDDAVEIAQAASGGGTPLDERLHDAATEVGNSLVVVPFNPTAENMASYLLNIIGPQQLAGTGVKLVKVVIDETRKCSAIAGHIIGGGPAEALAF